MNRRTLVPVIVFLAGAAVLAYGVWASAQGAKIGLGWDGFASAWPYLLAGVLTVAVVIAVFVRLAVISQKRGYDDRAGVQKP